MTAAQSSGRLSFTGFPQRRRDLLTACEAQRLLGAERGAEGPRIYGPSGVDMLVTPEHAGRIVAVRIGREAALGEGVSCRVRIEESDIVRGHRVLGPRGRTYCNTQQTCAEPRQAPARRPHHSSLPIVIGGKEYSRFHAIIVQNCTVRGIFLG